MASLTVEILTDEAVLYRSTGVKLVSAPGAKGQLGILPNHAPLLSLLDAGEVIVRKSGRNEHFVVFGGFVRVRHNHVLIMPDVAERAADIDLTRAKRALDRAELALEHRLGRVQHTEMEAALRRAMIRLKVGARARHYR